MWPSRDTSRHYLQWSRGGIFKLLWSPEIDSNDSILPAYVPWRPGTRTLFLLGSWPLIDCSKIPALIFLSTIISDLTKLQVCALRKKLLRVLDGIDRIDLRIRIGVVKGWADPFAQDGPLTQSIPSPTFMTRWHWLPLTWWAATLQRNPIYVFLFWELRGFGPSFHIHVSVSDLYIPRIGPQIWLQQNRQTDPGNI